MLDPVAGEDLSAAVFALDWDRYRDGALGYFSRPRSFSWISRLIRDRIELLASHAESRVIVDVHGANVTQLHGRRKRLSAKGCRVWLAP